jgi:hypothetical protein
MWKHVKIAISAYNHEAHYILYLAEYMFGRFSTELATSNPSR